ncbi:polysaccharide ABC transporter ATP-binding protein [Mucilaginibacter ximonensis]|uniref:Polysaccharide ABC transporter ATP-binding protein n=1 Tax=Mucilaginibacter ximonensis TaxID=538021 RepID=A0ABW5YDV9_9SPHI
MGDFGTGTISRDLERYWARLRGKEDPFLKIGETNDRTTSGTGDVVWSLKDINFEIEQGDAVGIIGRNGAGKSTLLKILSRITSPTTGSVKIRGRIASLLEVGTGFHPELTGRENIYLNGAILGMRKKEITRKFDEIVDFAGVERYVDTPVKRYSSGMYVRLAFAVAAHLESEILIVDEVLAVGDAEFQKKCLGKMGEVSKGEGRTVLFVSHNLAAVSTLTSRSIYLINGGLDTFGNTPQVIDRYLTSKVKDKGAYVAQPKTGHPNITRAEVIVSEPDLTHMNGKDLFIDIDVMSPHPVEGLVLSLQIMNEHDVPVVYTYTFDNDNISLQQNGLSRLRCVLPECRLYANVYYLRLHLAETKSFTKFEEIDRICEFEVVMPNKMIPWGWQKDVCVYTENFKWTELP